MKRLITTLVLALTLAFTTSAYAHGIHATADASVCGTSVVSVTGLSPSTAYQIVSVNSNVQITRNVTSTSSGTAGATYLRSEFPAGSSYDWGQIQVRTQYGGFLSINDGNILSYHFC